MHRTTKRAQLSSKLLALLIPVVLVLPLLAATPPSWWQSRGVLKQGPGVVVNDYAPLNQGQLKNLARAAALEMADKLESVGGTGTPMPGGTQSDIDRLVLFTQTGQSNDFAPVTLGQLKMVAKPFYERMVELKLIRAFPWKVNQATRVADDYSLANLGQAKNLFNFDFTTDSDQNGIADWWEQSHFGHLGVPTDVDSDGDGISNLQEYQNGSNPTLAQDTDQDGVSDVIEVAENSDPNQASSSSANAKFFVYTRLE